MTATLAELGVEVVPTALPRGAMHVMGLVRIVDRDLAVTWPDRLPPAAADALRARGYRVLPLPEAPAAERTTALNFVTLGPRRILMAEGYPVFQRAFRAVGIECLTTPVDELRKAAGSIGCLTGVVERGAGGA